MTKAHRTVIAVLVLAAGARNAWPQSPFLRGTDTRTATPESIMGQRKLWGADLGLWGAFNRGNTDVNYVSSSFNLFRVFGPATAYLNGNMTYNTFNGMQTLNQGSLTARYDHHIRGHWKAFVFNTEAYNEFLKLDHRATTGAGPWYDWELGPMKSGTSLALTHEYEQFHGGLIPRAARLSLRNLSSLVLSPTARISADLFYVPKADDFADNHISAELSLETTIWKELGIKLSWLDEYDSRPQPGVKANDTHILTSLTFHFGK